MKQERAIKKVIDILVGLGLTDLIHRKSKHHFIKGNLNGKQLSWTAPSTPSNQNSNKAAISNLRAELRKCGIEMPPKIAMHFTAFPNEKESLIRQLMDILDEFETE
jgi:hypothetical protein